MKKLLLGLVFAPLYIFAASWSVSNDNTDPINASWYVWTIENVRVIELTLNLENSALVENLELNKENKRVKKWKNWTIEVSWVQKNEERIAIEITNTKWDSIYYTNFDTKAKYSYAKKINQIDLIQENWLLKAKVKIYLHPSLDSDSTSTLLWLDKNWNNSESPDFDARSAELNIKTISYIYIWINNKKLGRIIKIK